jgi:hypothetical protein
MPAVPAIITAVGTIVAARMASGSSNRAINAQTQAANESLDFQRKQYADEQARLAREEAANRAAWDAEQARRAPYREIAANIAHRYYGVSLPTTPAPMPEGWTPASGSTATGAPATPSQGEPVVLPQSDKPFLQATPALEAPAATATLEDFLKRRAAYA